MRFIFIAILLSLSGTLFCQITSDSIAVGDISIIGFNSDNPDQFSFYCNNYIEEGIEIYFTDCGWTGTDFSLTEGHIIWKSPVFGIPGGTIVTITSTSGSGYFSTLSGSITASSDYGSILQVIPEPNILNSGMALATSGDQIISYVDGPTTPVFIASLNFNGSYSPPGTSSETLLPPGLTDGTSGILVSNYDNGMIDCLLLPDPPTLADFGDEANWILQDNPRVTLPPDLTDCTFVLPVAFNDFQAYSAEQQVLLQWSTASEVSNDYFTVERSSDGIHFYHIGYLPGAGTSTEQHWYETVDEQPLAGTSYYRIRQTDYNGMHSYSETRSVQMLHLNGITLYPNPAVDKLIIHAPYPGKLAIYSADGSLQFSTNTLGGTEVIDLSRIVSGLYTLIWSNQLSTEKRIFIKQ
jgi:hypothetical protein